MFARFETLEPRQLLAFAAPLADADGNRWTFPTVPFRIQNQVWFSATHEDARGIYRSDGTVTGTVNMSDQLPDLAGGFETAAVAGDRAFVVRANGELWTTDGTAAGTRSLASVVRGAGENRFWYEGQWAKAVGDKIYFRAHSPGGARWQLFVSDGTLAGTRSLTDGISNGYDVESIAGVAGNRVYFMQVNTSGQYRLAYATDSTAVVVSTLNTGASSVLASQLQPLNASKAIMTMTTGQGLRLWVTNGTGSGTLPVDTSLTPIGEFAVRNGVAYFLGRDGVGAPGIYRTDGTRNGTYRLADSTIDLTRNPDADAVVVGNTVIIHPKAQLDTEHFFAIAPDDSYTKSASEIWTTGDFIEEGSRVWLGDLGRYVTADSLLTPVTTDLNFVWPSAPFAVVGSQYLFVGQANPGGTTGTPYLYVWDREGPKTATVQGKLWNDADRDGILESGEPVIANAGITVSFTPVDGTSSRQERYTTTTADGSFTIDLIPPGKYTMRVEAPYSYIELSDPVSLDLANGTVVTGLNVLTGRWTRWMGYVYDDANGNGRRDAGEGPASGVEVVISRDNGSPSDLLLSVTTDDTGRYLILDAHKYHGYLMPVAANGWRITSAATSSTGSLPANYAGIVKGPDFGVTKLPLPGSVNANFYYDYNSSGSPDVGEDAADLPAVFVYADLNNDSNYSPLDEPGAFQAPGQLLRNVPAGTNTIRMILPDGWTSSQTSHVVVVPSTGIGQITNVGIQPVGTASNVDLRGRVFNDVDFDGVFSPSVDTLRPGSVLWDDIDADGKLTFGEPVAITDINGRYTFTTLPLGSHRITAAAQSVLLRYPLQGHVPVTTTSTTKDLDLPVYTWTSAIRISGQVRLDANDNKTVDADDPVLPDFSVQMNGSVTVSPALDGRFSYLGEPGAYAPQPVLPLGYEMVSQLEYIDLQPGQTKDDVVLLVDAPPLPPVEVSGRVYDDRNWNGIRDTDDRSIYQMSVYLDLNDNGSWDSREPITVTAPTGEYTLRGIPPGNYVLRTQHNNILYVPTNAGLGGRKIEVLGVALNDVDLGLGNISQVVAGKAYHDYNRDGIEGSSDLPIAGVKIWADLNNNGVFDPGLDLSTTTSSTGGYDLRTAVSRDTKLYVTPPDGYTSLAGSVVTVPPASLPGTFALSLPMQGVTGQINGQIYSDRNANGTFDEGDLFDLQYEARLLDSTTGAVIAAARTEGANRIFRFSGVKPGNYKVVAVLAGERILEGGDGYQVTIQPNSLIENLRFGHFPLDAEVSGTVMEETNGDNAGDKPLEGVRAFMDLNNSQLYDAGEPFAITDAQGHFTITGLVWDSSKGYPKYLIVENPAEYVSGSPERYPVYVSTGPGLIHAGTFLFRKPGVGGGTFISGYVYQDTNTNGMRDPGEEGIQFAKVGTSFAPGGSYSAVTTDSRGFYVYSPPWNSGTFDVRADMPTNWIGTDPKFGGFKRVTLSAGSILTGIDFGWVPWQVAGTLFEDQDGDGKFDSAEPVLAGRTVFADVDRDGNLDSGESSATTDNAGAFTFDRLAAGSFNLVQLLPSGWTAEATPVTLAAGEAIGGLRLSARKQSAPASITGRTHNDNNANGVFDTGDVIITGKTVFLDANANNKLDTGEKSVTSNSSGVYTFTNLAAGSYFVRRVFPTGYKASNPLRDYTLTAGQVIANADIGSVTSSTVVTPPGDNPPPPPPPTDQKNASIAGRTYNDNNANGVFDAGDAIITGKTVFLDANNNGKLDTGEKSTKSSSTGTFSFTGLAAGTYYVRRVFPTGYKASNPPRDYTLTAGQVITAADIGSVTSSTVVTPPGDNPPPPPPPPTDPKTASISGFLFWDSDRDGLFDTGESYQTAKTVFIDLDDDNILDSNEARVTSDSQGRFTFGALAAGTYVVKRVVPSGYKITSPKASITLTAGQLFSGVAIGTNTI